MSKDTLVMVGTPAYNSMVHTDFVYSLLEFGDRKIPYGLITIGGESLITRARNSVLAHFHHAPQYTHLLFLDGDVHLAGEDLARMLGQERDVIGAAVPLKTLQDGRPVFNVGGNLGQAGDLVKVEKLGTAVMLLSRQACTALVEDAIQHGRTYQANPMARGQGDTETVYDVFQVGVKDGIYLSEDYWVCNKLIELGFDVFVDPSIRTRHSGVATFGLPDQ